MVRIPTDRRPTPPGEMLLHEFLQPLGLTQRDLATSLHVPFQRVNEVVRGRRGGDAQHGPAAVQILGHLSRLLDEPATPLGPVPRAASRGRTD